MYINPAERFKETNLFDVANISSVMKTASISMRNQKKVENTPNPAVCMSANPRQRSMSFRDPTANFDNNPKKENRKQPKNKKQKTKNQKKNLKI